MKVIAFNGSPRKAWNTDVLLRNALEGAASQGAETEIFHLYDLDFKGCISCFECKKINGKNYGKCAIKDELTPILARIEDADAIIIGTPYYLGMPTSAAKAFLERLVFPYIVYETNTSTLFNKKISIGLIYTMGADEKRMEDMGYERTVSFMEKIIKLIFGAAESIIVNDTYQFEDYSKYVSSRFDPVEKARRRNEQFPNDCKKAYDMGVRFTMQR